MGTEVVRTANALAEIGDGLRSKHVPLFHRDMNGGGQYVFRFQNGLGASLIHGGQFAYGGLELAVIKFTGSGDAFHLTYDTPITDDVLGYLVPDELENILDAIAALPEQKKAIA